MRGAVSTRDIKAYRLRLLRAMGFYRGRGIRARNAALRLRVASM